MNEDLDSQILHLLAKTKDADELVRAQALHDILVLMYPVIYAIIMKKNRQQDIAEIETQEIVGVRMRTLIPRIDETRSESVSKFIIWWAMRERKRMRGVAIRKWGPRRMVLETTISSENVGEESFSIATSVKAKSDATTMPADQMTRQDIFDRIRRILGARDWGMLKAIHLDGLSVKEVARLYNLAPHVVSLRMADVRERLRRMQDVKQDLADLCAILRRD